MDPLIPPVGPRCRFTRLPLVAAECFFRFSQPSVFSVGELAGLAESLSGPLPMVGRFKGGTAQGFSFSVNDDAGMELHDGSGSKALKLTELGMSVIWQIGGEAYPGFETLVEIAARSLSAMPSRSVNVAGLVYAMSENSEATIHDLLVLPGQSVEGLRNVREYNVARRVSETMDHRTQFDLRDDSSYLLVVTGGVRVIEGPPLKALVEVYDSMQTMFAEMITDQARNRWGFEGVF